MEKLPAYVQLLKITEQLQGIIYDRELMSEKYSYNSLIRSKTGHKTSLPKIDFTQFSKGWMEKLSVPTIAFLVREVFPKIKLSNLLWHYETPKKRTEKMILKELVDNQVIFRTEVVGMYLINPTKVWRGTIPSCVEATKELLRRHRRPSPALIKDLKLSDKFELKSNEDYIREHQPGLLDSEGYTDYEVLNPGEE